MNPNAIFIGGAGRAMDTQGDCLVCRCHCCECGASVDCTVDPMRWIILVIVTVLAWIVLTYLVLFVLMLLYHVPIYE